MEAQESYFSSSFDDSEFSQLHARSQSKRKRLESKIMRKCQRQVDLIIQLILDGQCPLESVLKCKELIVSSSKFLERYEFVGWGNNENWDGQYPLGPVELLYKLLKEYKDHMRNPFDLLSFIFMLLKYFNEITTEEILINYDELSQVYPDRYQIYIGRGNAYYNDSQYLKAGQEYLKAQILQKTQKVYEYLAWVYIYHLQKKSCRNYSSKCLDLSLNNKCALFIQIQKYENSDFEQQMLELIQDFPEYYRLYVSLSRYYSSIGNQQEALKLSEKALNYDPTYAYSLMRKAQSLPYDCEQHKQVVETAISLSLKRDEVYFKCGQFLLQQEQIQGAVMFWKLCLEFNPYHLKSLSRLCELYSQIEGLEQDVIKYAQKYIELNPYEPKIYLELAKAHKNLSNNDEQNNILNQAYQMFPQNHMVVFVQGQKLMEKQQYLEAISKFHQSLRQKQSASTCYTLAKCYRHIREYAQAVGCAFKCLELDSLASGKYYCLLGELFMELGNLPRSLHWYLENIRVNQELNHSLLSKTFNSIPTLQVKEMINALDPKEPIKENLFWFGQVALLWAQLKCEKETISNLKIVEKIIQKMKKDDEQVDKEFIQQMLGNKDEGNFGLAFPFIFSKLAQNFEQIFRSLYENDLTWMQVQ